MVLRVGSLLAAILLVAGCAPAARESHPTPAPARGADFKPAEVRMPAITVHFTFGPGEFSEQERRSLPGEYEGAVLEGLNARAVLARDVTLVSDRQPRVDARAALARAREVQADHAVIVEVNVTRGRLELCREARRPFPANVTRWRQTVEVLRVRDGARRLALAESAALFTIDLEENCSNPAESQRRSTGDTLQRAVDKLLTRLVGA